MVLVQYYAKFFPNLAQVLHPMYKLLKKETKFEWNEECDKAFQLVKDVIASDKVLTHFNPNLPIKLTCDGSLNGIGAAYFHIMPDNSEKPIAFASKTLNKAESNYSTIDREALAIYFGVKKFAHYLIGRKFLPQTDHKPLISIFGDKKGIPIMAASRLQRWAIYLSSFDFTIEYIKGETNINADFLSRLPTKCADFKDEPDDEKLTYVNFMETSNVIDAKVIKSETYKDETLNKIIGFVKNGWPTTKSIKIPDLAPYLHRQNELNIERDILMWGYRVVVPVSLRKEILQQLHESHSGIVKMKAKARSHFWWPSLDRDIEYVANSCNQCLQSRQNPPRVPIAP